MPITELFSNPIGFLTDMAMIAPAIIIALTFHEAAHAYVAFLLGDPTAKWMGRLTLNPLKHLDPLGTALLFLAGFGYAKPVPINPRNFKKPRRDDLLVSVAGVTANIILSFLSLFAYYAIFRFAPDLFVSGTWNWLPMMLWRLFSINAVLFVFNLIPVPPLDGYHVLNDLVLKGKLYAGQSATNIGYIVMVIFMFTGIIDNVLSFFIDGIASGFSFVILRILGI